MGKYDREHYNKWNNKLGNNFTNNGEYHQHGMMMKNIDTDGAYQAKISGDYGEFTASSVLKSLPDYYAVMNDILLQTGTEYRKYQPEKYGRSPWKLIKKNNMVYEEVHKSTQIDHIIVSPFGIFVIETKNHKGLVFGDVNGAVWTQVINNGRCSSHYTFFNPVKQNQGHLEHLSRQTKIPLSHMVGMIVFTNPDAHLGNVNCNCCYTIDMLYQSILEFNIQLWTPKQMKKVIEVIEKLDTNSYTKSKEHEMYVQDLQRRKEINKINKYNRR